MTLDDAIANLYAREGAAMLLGATKIDLVCISDAEACN
jgi:hypothetical protein